MIKRFLKTACSLFLAASACLCVSAAFEKTVTYAEGTFKDIPSGAWYAQEVKNTYELGLMQGTSDTAFAPEDNVTLAQAITVASRVCAIYNGEEIPAAEGAWYKMYVDYAAKKGFWKTSEDDTTDYNRPATRLEVASLFADSLPDAYYSVKNDVTLIPDMVGVTEGYDKILKLYRAGFVLGKDDIGSFFPNKNIKRAEMSAIINRVALPENRLEGSFEIKKSNDDAYLLATHTNYNGNKNNSQMVTAIASGWRLDNRGSVQKKEYSLGYDKITDISKTEGVAFIREFNRTETGYIVLETTLDTDGNDGLFLEWRNQEDEAIYHVEVKDGIWQHKNADGSFTPLYTAGKLERHFDFRIEIDLDNAYSKTYINKNCMGVFPLISENVNMYNFRFAFTEEGTGVAYPGVLRAYVNYPVFEDFQFGLQKTVPHMWSVENAALTNAQDLLINDGGKAVRKFASTSGNIAFDYHFFQAAGETHKAILAGEGKTAFEITNDDKNIYVNGKVLYTDYVKNMWYRIRAEFDTNTHKAIFKLNGRKLLELDLDASVTSVDTLTFEAKGKNGITVDNIKLCNIVEHEDYVPEPKPIANDDDYTVGLNVCSLWVTGDFHKSWASVSAYPDKKPVLGYYDEGIPETADWEIKFLLEHGVDFQMFCWYPNTNTAPLKPSHANHLHDAFMNAKYSDMTKFAIIWEASGTNPTNVANFKNFYAPYIVENYFKDDRYMTIENKPVMVIFSVETLIKTVGGKEKFNECMDYLEAEAIKLGYDGMLLFTTGYTPLEMSDTRVDGAYPYSWSVSGYMPEINKLRMTENQRKSDIYNIPTISVGFNSIGWYQIRYPLMTKEGFSDVASWIKNEYLPEHAKESWQKNLVMLSTWNEYGEGTYIMPAEDNVGFGYLDSLKTALYGESEDTCDDIIPTENQKRRLNRIYPQYRNVLVHEGFYKMTYDDSNSKKLYGIDYSQEGSFEAPYKTENVVRAEKGVSGTCAGDTSVTHNVKEGQGPDLSEVSLVKICGTFPASDRIDMFYLTKDDGKNAFYAKKGLSFIANEAGTYDEYYVDVSGKGAIWAGELTRFRIDPATVDGTNFTLKSIEFLSAAANKRMYIDGTEVNMQFPPIMEGDVVTVGFEPAKAMDFLLDAFHEWNKADGELTLYFDKNTVKFKIGSDKYWLNGEEKALGFTLKELDGLPYVPIKLICDIEGYGYSIDDKGVVTVKTDYVEPEYVMAERVELINFYNHDYEEKDAPEGFKSITVHRNEDNPEYPYEYFRAVPKNNNSVYLYVFHDYTFVPGKTYRVVGDVRVVSQGTQIPAPLSVSTYVTFNMRYNDYKGVNHIVKRYNLTYKEEWQPVEFEFTVPEYSAIRDDDWFTIYTDPRNGMGMGYDFRNLCISDAKDPTNKEYEAALAERRKKENDKSLWELKGFVATADAGTGSFEVDTESAALLGESVTKPTFYKAVPFEDKTGIFYSTHAFTFMPGTKYKFSCDYKLLQQNGVDVRAATSFNMIYTDQKNSKNHVVFVQRQNSADGWQKVEFEFIVPEECVERGQDLIGIFTDPVNGKSVGYCMRNAKIERIELTPEDLIPDNIGGELYDFSVSSGVGKKVFDPENAENHCYLVMPTSDDPVYLYTTVPYTFEAGATYKLDIDLKVASKGVDMETVDNEFLTKIVFNMQYNDPAGKNHVIHRQPITIGDGWKHVTAEFTVSADSDSRAADRVSFYADPNVGISAGYYIDNLSVTKIS